MKEFIGMALFAVIMSCLWFGFLYCAYKILFKDDKE